MNKFKFFKIKDILISLLLTHSIILIGCGGASLKAASSTSVQNPGETVQASVRIVDHAGLPVSGVSVSGEWSGAISGNTTGVTGSDGYSTLTSPPADQPGTYTIKITSIAKAGYVYDTAKNKISQKSLVK